MKFLSTILRYRSAQGQSDAEIIDHLQCICGAEVTARLGVGHWTRQTDVPSVERGLGTRDTFLVYAGHEAIATFSVDEKLPPFFPPSIWRIPDAEALGVFDLAVLPSRQRCGVGTWIMRQIERITSDRGYQFVRLDAYEANPFSVAFYRNLGYDERARLVVNGVPILCFECDVTEVQHGS